MYTVTKYKSKLSEYVHNILTCTLILWMLLKTYSRCLEASPQCMKKKWNILIVIQISLLLAPAYSKTQHPWEICGECSSFHSTPHVLTRGSRQILSEIFIEKKKKKSHFNANHFVQGPPSLTNAILFVLYPC